MCPHVCLCLCLQPACSATTSCRWSTSSTCCCCHGSSAPTNTPSEVGEPVCTRDWLDGMDHKLLFVCVSWTRAPSGRMTCVAPDVQTCEQTWSSFIRAPMNGSNNQPIITLLALGSCVERVRSTWITVSIVVHDGLRRRRRRRRRLDSSHIEDMCRLQHQCRRKR